MILIKRNGRTYYGCPDCGRKFASITKLDAHKCEYKAEAVENRSGLDTP